MLFSLTVSLPLKESKLYYIIFILTGQFKYRGYKHKMKTRNKIVDAAVKLFSTNGYYKTKMDDIAKEAGVAKGTLYYNFSSKSDLFARIIVKGNEIILDKVKKDIEQEISLNPNKNIDALNKLEVLIKGTLQIYLKYDKLIQILVNEVSSSIDKQARNLIEKAKGKYRTCLASILENGIYNGEFREVPANIIAGSIVGTMEKAVITYINDSQTELSNEELIQLISELITGGLVR